MTLGEDVLTIIIQPLGERRLLGEACLDYSEIGGHDAGAIDSHLNRTHGDAV